MALTLARARLHLGIDVDDDPMINTNLQGAIDAAHARVLSAVGDDVEALLPADPRIDSLVLAYTADIYNNRETLSAKVNAAKQAWISDMELQLRLELRRVKETEA